MSGVFTATDVKYPRFVGNLIDKQFKKFVLISTSIVYATEKKQTKVEFPEARIYEETLNVLLYEGVTQL